VPTTASPFTCFAEVGRWPPIAAVLLDVDLSSDPRFPFSDAGTVVGVKEVSVASVAVRDTALVVVVDAEEGGTVVARAEAEDVVTAGAKEGGTVVARAELEDVVTAGAKEGGTVVARAEPEDVVTAGAEAEDIIVVAVYDRELGLPPSVVVGFAGPDVVFLSTSS
jgi:hypothetical protein